MRKSLEAAMHEVLDLPLGPKKVDKRVYRDRIRRAFDSLCAKIVRAAEPMNMAGYVYLFLRLLPLAHKLGGTGREDGVTLRNNEESIGENTHEYIYSVWCDDWHWLEDALKELCAPYHIGGEYYRNLPQELIDLFCAMPRIVRRADGLPWLRKEDQPPDPIKQAQNFQFWMEAGGLTHVDIAKIETMSRSEVDRRLKLLRLPEEVQEQVRIGVLSPRQAYEHYWAKAA